MTVTAAIAKDLGTTAAGAAATASLTADDTPPPGINALDPHGIRTYAWTIEATRYRATPADAWQASPQAATLKVPLNTAQAMVETAFTAAGDYQVVVKVVVSYWPGTNPTYVGSATATLSQTVTGDGTTKPPLIAKITQSAATPNPADVGDEVNVDLTAELQNSSAYQFTAGPTWTWTLVSVQWRPDENSAWSSKTPAYTPGLERELGAPRAHHHFIFSKDGDWSVRIKATVKYTTADGSGTLSDIADVG